MLALASRYDARRLIRSPKNNQAHDVRYRADYGVNGTSPVLLEQCPALIYARTSMRSNKRRRYPSYRPTICHTLKVLLDDRGCTGQTHAI